jgi:predicted DNA-binding transcriptional regulator AlpA
VAESREEPPDVVPDEVVTITGVAKILDVSRQRADELSRRGSFPKPLPSRDRVRVWRVVDVLAWKAQEGRG